VEDVLFGCAQPAGEQGYNLARVVALLAGLNDAPGATVNRYCSSSLQTIRMAAHAIKAGEGDVFVAGGVECVSRFDKGKSDGMEGTLNPLFNDAMARSKAFASGTPWAAVDGLPDVYTNMLQTAENVAGSLGVTRAEQDEFAVLSQNRAEAAQKSGFFRDEITPVTLANGTVVDTDDCPRAGTTLAAIAGLEPILKKWMGDAATVTAGNACPLNDGAAAVLVMSDKKAKELGLTPLARIVSSGVTGINPEIMGLGPVAASPAGARARGPHHQGHRPGGDQRGLRGAGGALGQAAGHPLREAQRERRRHRAGPSVWHDGRAHHDHAHPRPAGERRALRSRDHVRGRRPGHGHDHRAPLK
jgi:acetyl-CoA C-acetyltransferase